jgi:hypothetical protein
MKFLYVLLLAILSLKECSGAGVGAAAAFAAANTGEKKTFAVEYNNGANRLADPSDWKRLQNWHVNFKEALTSLRNILDTLPAVGTPGVPADYSLVVKERISVANYALASLAVVYHLPGSENRRIHTRTLPFIFSSGAIHRDRIPTLLYIKNRFTNDTGLDYQFASCDTFGRPNGESHIVEMRDMVDPAAYNEQVNGSQARVWYHLRGLHVIHPGLLPVAQNHLLNVEDPASNAARVTFWAHSENVILNYINDYQDRLLDSLTQAIPAGAIPDMYIINIVTLKDPCMSCQQHQFLTTLENLRGVPVSVFVSSIIPTRVVAPGSRNKINLQNLQNGVNPRYVKLLHQIVEGPND